MVNNQTGEAVELVREGNVARCWLEKLPAQSVTGFRPQTAPARPQSAVAGPALKLDAAQWPVSAVWPGGPRPLFDGGFGHFICVGVVPPADRRTITQLHTKFDAEVRRKSFP